MSWKKRPTTIKTIKESTPVVFQISLIIDDVEKQQVVDMKRREEEEEENERFNLSLRSEP